MTAAERLWLRSGGVWLVFVGGVLVVLIAIFSRDHWMGNLDIALQWANGATVLLSPLAGAFAAFIVWRAYPIDFQALTRTTTRGARTVLHLAIAVWLSASLAWLVGVATVAIGVWATGGSLITRDPWVLVAGLAAIFPAVMTGTFVAVAARKLAVAPLVGVFIYVVIVWTYPIAMPALMAVGGGTGTWTALRPLPDVVIASVLLNMLVGVLLAYGAWRLAAVHLRRLIFADLLGALALGGAVIVLVTFAQRESVDTHYVDEPVYACAGDDPETCVDLTGPLNAEAVGAQFADAHRALGATGIDLPRLYHEGGRDELSGAILLTEAPVHGMLDDFDLAMSLARPAHCEAYSGEQPPDDALWAQWVLGHWLDWQVRSDSDPADWRGMFEDASRDEVALWATEAHAALGACDLDASVLREVPDVASSSRW